MPSEREEEPKKGFKVVDRRRFDEAGDERTGPDVAPKEAPAPTPTIAAAPPAAQQAQQPQAQPPKPEAKKPAPTPEEEAGAISFSVFLQSMAQQALMQLGLIPWPHGQRELALEQARDTIDVLSLLRSKTKGNLTAEEDGLFETIVYELRMSYLEVNNAIARQAAQGPAGMRGPGSPGGGAPGRR